MAEFDVVVGDNGLEYITGPSGGESVLSSPYAARERLFQSRRSKRRRGPASRDDCGEILGVNEGEMVEFDVVAGDNGLEYVTGRDGGESVLSSPYAARERRFQPRRNKRRRGPASRDDCGENLSVGEGEMAQFDVVVGDNGLEYVTGPDGGESVLSSPYAARERRFQPRRNKRRRGPASRDDCGENLSVGEGKMAEFDVVAGDNGLEYVTGPDGGESVLISPYAARERRFQPRRNKRRRGPASRDDSGEILGVNEGDMVEFDVVGGDNGLEYVTGPDGESDQGNPHAARKHRFRPRRNKRRRAPESRVGCGENLREEASNFVSSRPLAEQLEQDDPAPQRWMIKGIGRLYNNRRFQRALRATSQVPSPQPPPHVVVSHATAQNPTFVKPPASPYIALFNEFSGDYYTVSDGQDP
ncbi:hypothetical protein MTO96_017545 [Rhipicephalus appendiculatus]